MSHINMCFLHMFCKRQAQMPASIYMEGHLRLKHHLNVTSLHRCISSYCLLKSSLSSSFSMKMQIVHKASVLAHLSNILTVPQLQLCAAHLFAMRILLVRLTVPQLNATYTLIYTKTYLMRSLNTNISPPECYKMRNVWYTPFIVAYIRCENEAQLYVCVHSFCVFHFTGLKSNFDTDNA